MSATNQIDNSLALADGKVVVVRQDMGIIKPEWVTDEYNKLPFDQRARLERLDEMVQVNHRIETCMNSCKTLADWMRKEGKLEHLDRLDTMLIIVQKQHEILGKVIEMLVSVHTEDIPESVRKNFFQRLHL